mgnify:FL=1
MSGFVANRSGTLYRRSASVERFSPVLPTIPEEEPDERSSVTTQPEPTLLERIAAGEQRAVNACLDQYGGLVWSLARRLSPNDNDAEDAVQEIFVEIWRHADRFDPSKASEATFVAM